jgi:hypothetical protein
LTRDVLELVELVVETVAARVGGEVGFAPAKLSIPISISAFDKVQKVVRLRGQG